MAILTITTAPDGTYTLRAVRMAGKELAAHKTAKGIKKSGIQVEGKKLMDVVAPRTANKPGV